MIQSFIRGSAEKAIILAEAKYLIKRYGDAAHLAARFQAGEAMNNPHVTFPPGYWQDVEIAINNMLLVNATMHRVVVFFKRSETSICD